MYPRCGEERTRGIAQNVAGKRRSCQFQKQGNRCSKRCEINNHSKIIIIIIIIIIIQSLYRWPISHKVDFNRAL